MKIAVVYQHYYPETFRITPLCEELVNRGHNVTVYTGLPNYPHGNVPAKYKWFKNRHEYHNGVKIERSFEIGRKSGKLGLAINYISYTISSIFKALFADLDFDVIYAYSTSPILMSIQGLVLKKRSNKKMLIYVLDLWPASLSAMNIKQNSLLYKLMHKVSNYVYRSCDIITYSSKSFKKYMADVHNINFLDENYIPQFADKLFENSNIISKPNDGNFIFVFAGNIGHMQSVDTIIKSANELQHLPITWYILGEGSEFDKNKLLVASLGLTNKVYMPGKLDLEEMPKYYAMADALIVTMSNNELINYTLPAKVQSYMAFGKPILASINGEAEKIINEAKCGLCCEAENYIEFANIVNDFINMTYEDRMLLAQNSKNYYDNNFKLEAHIHKLESHLESIIR